MTKHLLSGDGIWPIINPPLTDFVWELCAKWPFISSAQTELRKIVELKAYLINAETFSSWGMSWNWEFYRRRQIQWLMHPRHLPLTNWNWGSRRKKKSFSILSRIDCWHWSLTSPYRVDLELLTKRTFDLLISNYRVGLWAISSFSLGQWFQIAYCPIFPHKPHANLNSLTKEWLPYVCGWFG